MRNEEKLCAGLGCDLHMSLLRDLVNTKVFCNVMLDRLLGGSANRGEKLLQAELQ